MVGSFRRSSGWDPASGVVGPRGAGGRGGDTYTIEDIPIQGNLFTILKMITFAERFAVEWMAIRGKCLAALAAGRCSAQSSNKAVR